MALTTGANNVLQNEELNALDKFWKLNSLAKTQNKENCVRTHDKMKSVAKKALEQNLIAPDNKFYDYVKSFANGKVETNTFGKLLYFKRSFN